jgi:hypothetical protein
LLVTVPRSARAVSTVTIKITGGSRGCPLTNLLLSRLGFTTLLLCAASTC